MESLPLLALALLVAWIFRKSITTWARTAEDKSDVTAMKVSLLNRKDESELLKEAQLLLDNGYKGLNSDMRAFILKGTPIQQATQTTTTES